MKLSKLKNTKFYQFIRTVTFFYLYQFFLKIKKIFRKVIKPEGYRKLKKLQNIHDNDRCFIIATGPSMSMDDLKKLNNEITFGMNSLCRAFDEIGWETTYFAIQDKSVYKKMYKDLGKLSNTKLFVSDDNSDVSQIKCNLTQFPLNIYNHKTVTDEFIYKFSDSICDEISSGFTIAYSALQIAIYMGFKEIYLLGADYLTDPPVYGHFYDGYHEIGNPSDYESYRERTSWIVEHLNNKGCKVFNVVKDEKQSSSIDYITFKNLINLFD
jgi:hypothetical protein